MKTETNPTGAFQKFMADNGYHLQGLPVGDGQIHRFQIGDKRGNRNGWYILHIDNFPVGIVGNWSNGTKFKWTSKRTEELSEKEIKQFQAKAEAQRKKMETARRIAQAEAQKRAAKIWNASKPASADHPYLKVKGFTKTHGLRERSGRLVVPVRDVMGNLMTLQFIASDGSKRFLKDGVKKSGCFSFKGDGRLFICEGVATGGTIHEATGGTVIVAFDAGNLNPVARVVREKYPDRNIVIAGDDDLKTEGNPGRTKAESAGRAVKADVVFPMFKSDTSEGTDFNDLAKAEGIEEVRKQLGGDKNISSKRTGFRFAHISEIKNRIPEWVIKNMMEWDSLIEFFGDPASGKTLLAIDVAACIAAGKDFNGRAVKQGPIAYIAGEGQNGIKRRFMAWSIRNDVNLDDIPLFVSLMPAALCDQEQHRIVVGHINAIAEEYGSPVLVVIDTVARNFGPGDENSTKDMTAFIQAVDAIRAAHRSTVLLVHHTGHADKSRARGAMALKGALDAEYRLDRDVDGVIRVECTKMKDFQMPESMAFRLRTVELGIKDEDGQPVTGAVLDPTTYKPEVTAVKSGRGKNQQLGLEILQQLFNERRQNLIEGGFDPKTARVSTEDWRDACVAGGMDRRAFFKIKESLQKSGSVKFDHGFVDLV